VRELVVASVLDVPMKVSQRTVGALCLYGSHADGFTADDQVVAQTWPGTPPSPSRRPGTSKAWPRLSTPAN
jgi:hypothetical protein